MIDKNNKHNLLLIILILSSGLLLRLLYLYQFSESPLIDTPVGPDVEEYNIWAKEILSGRLLWDKVNIHAPLYPFFLAMLYSIFKMDLILVRATQLLIGLLAGLPLFFVLNKIYKKSTNYYRYIPHTGLAIWSLYPPLIFYQAELTSEALLIPLLCISLYLLYLSDNLLNKGSLKTVVPLYLMSGFFLAINVLTHPISIFFAAGIIIYMSIDLVFSLKNKDDMKKQKTVAIISLLGSFMIIVSTICIYNSYIDKSFVLIQKNSGFNFYLGNNPESTGSCYLRPGPEWDRIHNIAKIESVKKGVSKNSYFLGKSMGFIVNAPIQWIYLLLKKGTFTWNYRELTAGADLTDIRYFTPIQKYTSCSFAIVAILSLVLIFAKSTDKKFIYDNRFLLILTATIWGAQILLVTSGRYRTSMLPGIILLSAQAPFLIVNDFLKRKYTYLVLFGCISLFVIAPTPEIDTEKESAEANSILGEAYLLKKDNLKAIEHLIDSSKKLGHWSRTFNLLGNAFSNIDKFDTAQEMYKKAIKCNPESPNAYMNIANMLSDKNLNKEAEEFFLIALKKSNHSAELFYNYGYFLIKTGRRKVAKEYLEKSLKLSPADRKTINALGVIAFQDQKFKQALQYFLLALKLAPNMPQTLVNISLVYATTDKIDISRKYLNKAIALDPNLKSAQILKKSLDNIEKGKK